MRVNTDGSVHGWCSSRTQIKFVCFVFDWTVRISAVTDREEDGFLGFIMQGRDDSGVVQGTFDPDISSDGVQTLSCMTDNDTATHSNPDVKQSVDLVWNAPDQCSFNDVYFR